MLYYRDFMTNGWIHTRKLNETKHLKILPIFSRNFFFSFSFMSEKYTQHMYVCSMIV